MKKLITITSILLISLSLSETDYAKASSYVDDSIVEQTNYDIDIDDSTYVTDEIIDIKNTPIIYTNKDTINFTSAGKIISYSVYENAMESAEFHREILYDGILSSCSYKIDKKNSEYFFAVNFESGNTKYFKYYYDCTAPVFGFKKNEKITAGCTVDVYDEGSGIETITLNGKKVSKYYRFKKKGNYTIKVTDIAGNESSIKVICTSNCPSWASKLPSIYNPKKRANAIAKNLKINHYSYAMKKYNGKTMLILFADTRTHKVYDYNGTYLYTEHWD